MAIDITQSLPTKPAAASTARAPQDSDRAKSPAPATPEADEDATENAGAETVDPARLAEAVRRANKTAELFSAENRGLRFEVNEPTQHVVVKVLDEDEERVVRQFPPDEFLEASARLRELRSVLVDRVA